MEKLKVSELYGKIDELFEIGSVTIYNRRGNLFSDADESLFHGSNKDFGKMLSLHGERPVFKYKVEGVGRYGVGVTFYIDSMGCK